MEASEIKEKKRAYRIREDKERLRNWILIGSLSYGCYFLFMRGYGEGYMEDVFFISFLLSGLLFVVKVPRILYICLKFLPGGKNRIVSQAYEIIEPQYKINTEEEREEEKKSRCSYCNSGTNYSCDVANSCKSGICKKCRESGKAKENYTKVVTKKGGISNRVAYYPNGYQCKKCSTTTSKWGDDGSDVGY